MFKSILKIIWIVIIILLISGCTRGLYLPISDSTSICIKESTKKPWKDSNCFDNYVN